MRLVIARVYGVALLLAWVAFCILGMLVAAFPAIAGLFVYGQLVLAIVFVPLTVKVLRWMDREASDSSSKQEEEGCTCGK
jgi:hypothetical protein